MILADAKARHDAFNDDIKRNVLRR